MSEADVKNIPRVSVMLCLYQGEAAEAAAQAVERLCAQNYDDFECIAVCADNTDEYSRVLGGMVRIADLSGRSFRTAAQLKNAAVYYARGSFIVFVTCGMDAYSDSGWLARLMEGASCCGAALNDDNRLLKNLGSWDCVPSYIAFSREAFISCGGLNGELSCGEEYELAIRIQEGTVQEDGLFMLVNDEELQIYQEIYLTYAYIIGRCSEVLRQNGWFDNAVMRCMSSAKEYGVDGYFLDELTHMVSRDRQYYRIYNASQPVLIYMGDPICFDVLTSFALNFSQELQKHGIAAEIYDMSAEGTRGLARYAGGHYRAVVGFQTALFAVCMKDSGELINNRIDAPKINFLYDHPLYLYYHFTLKLNNYYVLTQDEDYADYIKKYYPAIDGSMQLPPAGIELPDSEKIAWENKIYDIVFVGSYHNYRERMLALEMNENDTVRQLAGELLEVMKDNPNMSCESALEKVLSARDDNVDNTEFAILLNKCMDACRIVMFFYREKVVEVILDAGLTLHVFGESWRGCPLADRENLIIHPDVLYAGGIEIMAQSRIALNIMSWHKAGMTERVANIMLNNTVCLTDKTRYLEKHFTDGVNIVMYDLEKLDELPGRIRALLDDEKRMRDIASAGRAEAFANHRWSSRVEEFIDMLNNGVFEPKQQL